MSDPVYRVGGSGIVTLFPKPITSSRNPTTKDRTSPSGNAYPIFQSWHNSKTKENFIYNGFGFWAYLSSGKGEFSITGDDEIPVFPIDSNTNIVGDPVSGTRISGNTETATLTIFSEGETTVVADDGTAISENRVFTLTGKAALASGNPIVTEAAGKDISILVQLSSDVDESFVSEAGLSSFNNEFFSVDNGGFVSFTTEVSGTALHAWNGCIIELVDFQVFSDGVTITFFIEQQGGGDLTVVFSDGAYTWDTTPAAQIILPEGTDQFPIEYYIYFLQSTKTLEINTIGWPPEEHASIARIICPSAVLVQSDGAYKGQNSINNVIGTNSLGHIYHINEWIRQHNAFWQSGVLQTYEIITQIGIPDSVLLLTTAGVISQLHPENFPSFTTPTYYVVNYFGESYKQITNLNEIILDSLGISLSGRYFSLVFSGIVSENTIDCKIFINAPSGSYANETDVLEDLSHYANYSFTDGYRGSQFEISEWKIHHQVISGGTYTSIAEIDLRKRLAEISGGGGTSEATRFPSNLFGVFNELDDTSSVGFDVSAISPLSRWLIKMTNKDFDLSEPVTTIITDNGTIISALNTVEIVGDGIVISTEDVAGKLVINSSAANSFLTPNGTGIPALGQMSYLGVNVDISATGNVVTFTGIAASSEFSDTIFEWFNSIDITKKQKVDLSAITSGTTRTLTMVDLDLDLTNVTATFNCDLGTTSSAVLSKTNLIGGTDVEVVASGNNITFSYTGSGGIGYIDVATSAIYVPSEGEKFLSCDTINFDIRIDLPTELTDLYREFVVKDRTGNASIKNITVTTDSGLIDGKNNYILSANYESANFIFNGTDYEVY